MSLLKRAAIYRLKYLFTSFYIQENPVATLDDVFEVEVSLDKSVIGANPLAELIGTTRMMFTNVS